MAKVKVLPEVLAHKIAAGEIVERPASVVKELLENALDAGAKRINVRVENGGMSLISVSDDGEGMSAEDAKLAFEHHATSKISSFEDLSRITTLGFRGEALPSIASVSRLRLRTVEKQPAEQSVAGTEIEFLGGNLRSVREIAWPVGTEVLVEDLFFNVPARRKFLKAPPTELTYISRQVVSYALASPEAEFHFTSQERSTFEAPAVPTLEERAYQVLGEEFLNNLVPVEFEKEGVRIYGFTSLPHEQRSSTASQFLYVNRRMVRDRVLTHAVQLAYRDLIPSGTYPVVLLFLEIDPQQTDVNVHPCKTEIRFRDSNVVHSAIFHGIQEALLRCKGDGFSRLARDVPFSQFELPGGDGQGRSKMENRRWPFSRFNPRSSSLMPQAFVNPPSSILSPPSSILDPHGSAIPETDYVSAVPVVLGQFVESFVVAADREGVMLIDQHVAHERILYDQALPALESSAGCPTQQLLLPITLELNAAQRVVMEQILQELNRNGFEVEWFGAQTIVIKGIPAVASGCDVGQLVEEILQTVDSGEHHLDLRRLREKIAISLSCRAAIKINTPLSAEKMQWLVDALFRTDHPYTCPHGRPIVLRLNIEEILRGFKRI